MVLLYPSNIDYAQGYLCLWNVKGAVSGHLGSSSVLGIHHPVCSLREDRNHLTLQP